MDLDTLMNYLPKESRFTCGKCGVCSDCIKAQEGKRENKFHVDADAVISEDEEIKSKRTRVKKISTRRVVSTTTEMDGSSVESKERIPAEFQPIPLKQGKEISDREEDTETQTALQSMTYDLNQRRLHETVATVANIRTLGKSADADQIM